VRQAASLCSLWQIVFAFFIASYDTYFLRFCNTLLRYALEDHGPNQQHIVQIIDAARNATVRVTSAQPDAVVWNPWVAKSKARAQLDAAACFCSGLI
jgi:hypothetical protein